jgi:hypothetical protein
MPSRSWLLIAKSFDIRKLISDAYAHTILSLLLDFIPTGGMGQMRCRIISMSIRQLSIRLLAICLLLVGMAGPACAYEPKVSNADSCCCEKESYDSCSITNGGCCSVDGQQDQAPPATFNQLSAPPAVSESANANSFAAVFLSQSRLSENAAFSSKPLHLASNKVYLKKRSLLI